MNLRTIEERLKREHDLPDDFVFWAWKCFPPAAGQTIYGEFKGENEADVLHALDCLGKTNEVINYANIMRYVGENKTNREWGNSNKRKAKPPIEGSPAPEYEDMPPETQKAIDKFRDKCKW